MNTFKKKLRKNRSIRSWYEKALHKGLIPWKRFVPWQLVRNNSADKWSLIETELVGRGVTSLLDIGCDAGQVTRLAASAGLFAVGVDQNTSFLKVEEPTKGACFGNIILTDEKIDQLPEFGAILLLSVHHQWVRIHGDQTAKEMLRKIFSKTTHALFVEHTALNERFGYDPHRFRDNDELSVRAYAEKWLDDALPSSPRYLGKVRESVDEPYRFMYVIDANK